MIINSYKTALFSYNRQNNDLKNKISFKRLTVSDDFIRYVENIYAINAKTRVKEGLKERLRKISELFDISIRTTFFKHFSEHKYMGQRRFQAGYFSFPYIIVRPKRTWADFLRNPLNAQSRSIAFTDILIRQHINETSKEPTINEYLDSIAVQVKHFTQDLSHQNKSNF